MILINVKHGQNCNNSSHNNTFSHTVQSQIHDYYDSLICDCKQAWNDYNISKRIDLMEQQWTNWDVKDALLWFKYNLVTHGHHDSVNYKHYNNNGNGNGNDYDSDYTIDDLSDSDDDSDDQTSNNSSEIDWNIIDSKMKSFGFRAKRNFPNMNNHYIFKQFGFKNKTDCKLLCEKTKRLLQKYPKTNKRKDKKSKERAVSEQMEGMVEDTNVGNVK